MPNNYDQLLNFVKSQIEDSRESEKRPREAQVLKNWNYYHGNIDWSHKKKKDSKIHMHKIGIAAERHRAKFKQNLVRFEQWMSVELEQGFKENIITTTFAKNITVRHLDRAKGKNKISDAILFGEMEGRAALKTGWEKKIIPRFIAKGTSLKKTPHTRGQLCIDTRDFNQLHVDQRNPARPMFIAEEIYVDLFEIKKLSSESPTEAKPYRKSEVDKLTNFERPEIQDIKNAQEGKEENKVNTKDRPQVQVINYYGTVLDAEGNILMWDDKPLENIFVTIANDEYVIRDPQTIPRWSGQSGISYSDLLRVPGQGIKAIMDAGVSLNQAENELVNSAIDGALRAGQHITWYRERWIADKKKISGGLQYGDSIPISDDAPINAEPIGTVKTGDVPQEVLAILQVVQRAYAENVFSNQLDLSGNLPTKQVRATEVNQASQAIGDIFDALAMDVEEELIEPFLYECFLEIMQNSEDLSEEEVIAAFGPDSEELAQEFLALTPQERFAEAANGFRFIAKGLRGQIANSARAQAVINFISTITSNPIVFQAVEAYISIPKLVMDVAKGLGLDGENITTDPEEKYFIKLKQKIQAEVQAQAQNPPQEPQPGNARQGSQPSPEQPGPIEGF